MPRFPGQIADTSTLLASTAHWPELPATSAKCDAITDLHLPKHSTKGRRLRALRSMYFKIARAASLQNSLSFKQCWIKSWEVQNGHQRRLLCTPSRTCRPNPRGSCSSGLGSTQSAPSPKLPVLFLPPLPRRFAANRVWPRASARSRHPWPAQQGPTAAVVLRTRVRGLGKGRGFAEESTPLLWRFRNRT